MLDTSLSLAGTCVFEPLLIFTAQSGVLQYGFCFQLCTGVAIRGVAVCSLNSIVQPLWL